MPTPRQLQVAVFYTKHRVLRSQKRAVLEQEIAQGRVGLGTGKGEKE